MNVYQRMAAVMADVKYVQKTGWNAFHKYKYAKEADYIESLRPALLKHGLIIFPIVQHTTVTGELTTIEMTFRIQNVADPKDYIDVPAVGQGTDKGDKSAYKAQTGAKKYMISLAFLIETGDDAEADETTDVRANTPKVAEAKGEYKVADKPKPVETKPTTTEEPATKTEAKPTEEVKVDTPRKTPSFRKTGQAPLANGAAKTTPKDTTELTY